jgi:hypothetical protein
MTAASGISSAPTWRYMGVILAAASLCGTIAFASVPATSLPLQEEALENIAASPNAEALVARSRKRTRCEECGVVQSVRRIDAVDGLAPTYEITIRLRNGSIRTNTNATPGNWQPGDRIMLIKGGRAAKAPTV